jgi:AcrR family transcriptional regulator
MARPQAENYAEIRRGILRKSASLFARQGYPSTSIADLAAANGISRGLLYHYFESKEMLLAEMLGEHLDMLLAEVRAASGQGADIEARFRNTIRAMVLVNARSKDLQIVLLHDLHNLNAGDRARIVHKQRAILALVRGLIAAFDGGRTVNARTLKVQTMMLMGMINYTYLWYDPRGPVGPEEYAALVADTYFGGLRARHHPGATRR